MEKFNNSQVNTTHNFQPSEKNWRTLYITNILMTIVIHDRKCFETCLYSMGTQHGIPLNRLWKRTGWPILIRGTTQEPTSAAATAGKSRERFGKNEDKWTGNVEFWKEKKCLAVDEACMVIIWPTSGFKRRTFEHWVLNGWVLYFCVLSTPLREPNWSLWPNATMLPPEGVCSETGGCHLSEFVSGRWKGGVGGGAIRRRSLKQPTYTGSKFNTCDFHRRQLTSYGNYLQLPRHVRSATKDRAPEESVHLATKTGKSSHLSLPIWLIADSPNWKEFTLQRYRL